MNVPPYWHTWKRNACCGHDVACTEKNGPPPKTVPRTNLGSQNWSPLPISVPHENVILQPSKVPSPCTYPAATQKGVADLCLYQ